MVSDFRKEFFSAPGSHDQELLEEACEFDFWAQGFPAPMAVPVSDA